MVVMILCDAALLVMLMQVLSGTDTTWGTAIIVSIVAAIGLTVLAVALGIAMGLLGVVLACLIVAGILAYVISSNSDVTMPRASLIACLFIVGHIFIAYGLTLIGR